MKRDVTGLSIANDFIFCEIMRQPENVKPLLEAVLEKKNCGNHLHREAARHQGRF